MSKGRSHLKEIIFMTFNVKLIGQIFIVLAWVGILSWNTANQVSESKISRSVAHQCMQSTSDLFIEDNASLWWQGMHATCTGRGEEAIHFWRTDLQQSADHLHLIRSFYRENSVLAETAVKRYPNNSLVFLWLGDSYLAAGNRQAAAEAYIQGLELDPSDGLKWRQLGDYFKEIGDINNALWAYDQACSWVDRGKNGCLLAAQLYTEQGDHVSAEMRYRDSLTQLRDFKPARFGLAQALIAQNRTNEALIYLTELSVEGYSPATDLLETLP